MDIIGRLNLFLDENEITKSKFADSCGIPRPTVSQILSGRNQKISDDIISKIHIVYPNLSILWLMFGEGDMHTAANSGISAIESVDDSDSQLSHVIKPSENSLFENYQSTNLENQNMQSVKESVNKDNAAAINTLPKYSDYNVAERKISKIVVFYSDNSFEEFFK